MRPARLYPTRTQYLKLAFRARRVRGIRELKHQQGYSLRDGWVYTCRFQIHQGLVFKGGLQVCVASSGSLSDADPANGRSPHSPARTSHIQWYVCFTWYNCSHTAYEEITTHTLEQKSRFRLGSSLQSWECYFAFFHSYSEAPIIHLSFWIVSLFRAQLIASI